MKFVDTRSIIFLPGLQVGPGRFPLPGGLPSDLSGLRRYRANPSARQAMARRKQTKGTCGPGSSISSASYDLQQSLASKLQARTDVAGSMEYLLTWKVQITPARRPICLLQARVRPTCANGYFGWPTPTAALAEKAIRSAMGALREALRSKSPDLAAQVALASWLTPTSRDYKDHGDNVNWAKVQAKYKLHGQVQLTAGMTSISLAALITSSGVLNPEHCRWLMGYPAIWSSLAPTENYKPRTGLGS